MKFYSARGFSLSNKELRSKLKNTGLLSKIGKEVKIQNIFFYCRLV